MMYIFSSSCCHLLYCSSRSSQFKNGRNDHYANPIVTYHGGWTVQLGRAQPESGRHVVGLRAARVVPAARPVRQRLDRRQDPSRHALPRRPPLEPVPTARASHVHPAGRLRHPRRDRCGRWELRRHVHVSISCWALMLLPSTEPITF